MDFLKCNECKYEENCPVMWSYCNAACITIQKKKENKMDNSIYEVGRAEYKTFIGQLNTENTHVEESWVGDIRSTKIYGDKSGKHLCTRLEDTENEKEHYFIFNYPIEEEYREPTPIMTVNLDTKEEVQAFFNALSELQKEARNNDGNI